ncbi:MAG: hypothetical protein ACFFC3_15775 [Candidatus Odinarchaeota archaeon]
MKKLNIMYIIVGLIFISLISGSISTVAWKNGEHMVGTYDGDPGWQQNPVSIYKNYYFNPTSTLTLRIYYGTHDWIAESALELLYSLRGSDEFLRQLWDINNPDELRFYYLYGTELPDSWMIPSGLTFRCNPGAKFTPGMFGSTSHNKLRFYDDGSLRDDSACQVANRVYDRVKQAFQLNDCQMAALFIGALMHIVADATYYAHVLENARSWAFEEHVMYVTFKTWTDVGGDRSNEFFNLDEVRGKLTAADMFNPYQATLLAGESTRFGSALPHIMDAEFLRDSAPSNVNHKFWADIQGYWSAYSQEISWTHSIRPNVPYTSIRKYFDTIEHNLNQAVYYCATVLNYILEFAGYKNCDCGSGSGNNPNPPPPDGDKEGVKDSLSLSVKQFEGLFYFNMMGLMATAIALAILPKTKLLEELLPLY